MSRLEFSLSCLWHACACLHRRSFRFPGKILRAPKLRLEWFKGNAEPLSSTLYFFSAFLNLIKNAVVRAVICLSLCTIPALAAEQGGGTVQPTTPDDSQTVLLLERGLWAYREGKFNDAIDVFAEAVQRSKQKNNLGHQVDALMFMSDAYESLGMKRKSTGALESARSLVHGSTETEFPASLRPGKGLDVELARLASLDARLGRAYQALGRHSDAQNFLSNGIKFARAAERPDLLAALHNDLGNTYVAFNDISMAISAFETSERIAKDIGNRGLATRAGINSTRARIEGDRRKELAAHLNDNIRATRAMSDPREKAENLLAIGDLLRTAQKELNGPTSWRKNAHDIFREGLALAEKVPDQRLASYALGYLGGLYEDEGRYAEALQYTQRASFAAQEVDAYESLYRWEWQAARLLRAQGKTEESIIAYRQAINTLQKIRSDLAGGTGPTFRQLVGPVFLELADLLLGRTATLKDKEAIRLNLSEVRNTLEQVKIAEIEDYFQHDCVLPPEKTIKLEDISPESAVIYPVLLRDRTEILVSLPDGLRQFTSEVGEAELTQEVRKFRESIETDKGRGATTSTPGAIGPDQRHLGYGKNLYEWLIAPLEQTLKKHNIRTLVFIPDGPLRSIPIAALNDGEKFLIEKYAVANTLGLNLTNPKPIARENVQVLLNGLTEAVQGFRELPNVSSELAGISKLYPSKLFKDKDFLLATAEKEMSEGTYSIVHIASHGQFKSDHRESFVLTYDDKLTMNRLEQSVGLRRFQEESLELLVLSACQTAAGDDRAALGLAGIALKAGARSALASLWLVDDKATSVLISEFYRQLKDKNISKAKALQNAQLMLVHDERYRHPNRWAPFLLIGNWL